MNTRQLGRNGPQVSVIAFGAWPIGGGLGSVPEAQGIAAVHAALDAGMTFIDTAEGYLTSESVVGKAIKDRRHEAFLATKLSGDDHSATHITAALENSLRALSADYIDLYQLHSPQPQWPIADTMANLVRLQDDGKIRHIGVSNFSPEQTQEAMQHAAVQSSQPRYNLMWRNLEDDVLPYCLQNGIGVIPHSVLCKGILAGKHKPGHQIRARRRAAALQFLSRRYVSADARRSPAARRLGARPRPRHSAARNRLGIGEPCRIRRASWRKIARAGAAQRPRRRLAAHARRPRRNRNPNGRLPNALGQRRLGGALTCARIHFRLQSHHRPLLPYCANLL